MNILNKSRKESGVGLIEILIVLVVLVIGWAAIAALQGNLMSGSSSTKARNIALELAREKTEEMRTAIEKGRYDDELVSGATDGKEIINATFTRSWVLSDVDINGSSVGHLKQLVMTVSWENNEDKTEKVVLNSMIAFSDPMRSVSLVTGGADNASRLAPLNSETGREGPGKLKKYPSEIDPGDGDPGTDDGIYSGVDEDGNLVVFQGIPIAVDDGWTFDDGLIVYGGKILEMRGTIYYENPDQPMAQATSPAFCATFVKDCGLLGTQCVRYVCYAGGDCSGGGDGCGTVEGATNVSDLPDLNGGWYGKIGDFFPTLDNPTNFPIICMGDPLNRTTDESGKLNESFISIGVPARLYVTKRLLQAANPPNPAIFSREGINTSFDGHDTLIASVNDPQGTLCEGLFERLISNGIEVNPNPESGGVDNRQLADYKIIRCLAKTDTNYVVGSSGFFDPDSVADLLVCQPPEPVDDGTF